MKPRNITLIISSMRSGGAERVMMKLANTFASAGHNVNLILFTPETEKPFYNIDKNVNVISLNCLSYNKSPIIYVKNIIYCLYILRKTIKKLSPDVIISFLESVNLATLIATFNLNIPVIISERIDPAYHRISRLYMLGRTKIYPLCNRLVVQTQSVYDFFPKHFSKFINIIPNPVNSPSLLKNNQSDVLNHFVTVGRLTKQKDQITLLNAFAKFIKINKEAKLTIYGEGEERSALESIIQNLSLQKHVSIPGTISDIQGTLIQYDAFIFPSLYEGFPNALCEAMSIGLPVIASNVTGNKDIIDDGENGLLFTAQDVDALLNCMIRLQEKDLREYLAKNAKNIADTYSDAKIYKQWYKVIDDICVE